MTGAVRRVQQEYQQSGGQNDSDSQRQTGDSVEVYGVFSAGYSANSPGNYPAKIIHAGDNNMAPHDLVAPSPLSPK